MSEVTKTQDFLQKLAPCVERGELEACVEEAARVALEMGVGAEELLEVSVRMWKDSKLEYAYVLSLAAAEGLENFERATAYSIAGQLAKSIGKLTKALEYHKKAIDFDPKNVYKLLDCAILLHKLDRKIEAEEYYKKAIEANPKLADVHYNYANLLKEWNRKIEAEEHYVKAIRINPNCYGAHNNYALFLQKLDRKKEAEGHFIKAIEINPKLSYAHNNYANLLRERAQFYEAEKEVRIALQIEPENPYAHGTLGDIYADEDYFDEAVIEYQTALKNSNLMKDSTTSEIHNNLGWVYAKTEQYYIATREFKKAKILDPMNVKANRNLRALGKVRFKNEINTIQIFLGTLLLVSIYVLFDLFMVNRISEAVFATQSSFLIALLIFIFLYPQLSRFKAGSVEFELSTEHKFVEAKSQIEFER